MNKPIFLLSLLLMSCDAEIPESKTIPSVKCIANLTTKKPVEQNSIVVSVQKYDNTQNKQLVQVPFNNVIVQLNHNGPCMRTNNDGLVTFDGLSIEPHQIHVFAPTGFQWRSDYTVLPGTLNEFNLGFDSTLTNHELSFVRLSGSITNKDPGSEIVILNIDSSGYRSTAATLSGNSYSVDLRYRDLPGSVITGDIIVFEYKNDLITGEKAVIDTKVIKNVQFTTALTKKNITAFDIKLSISKPVLTPILEFNRINLPPGFDLNSISVYSDTALSPVSITNPLFILFNQSFKKNTPKLNLLVPFNFSAYDQFNFTQYKFILNAGKIIGDNYLDLYYYKDLSKNVTNIIINPSIAVFPNIVSKQTGDTLYWENINTKLTQQRVVIISKDGATKWVLNLDPSATSIRMPKIPTAIKTRLSNQNQGIYLTGRQQNGSDSELYSIYSDTWSPQL